MNFWEVLLGRKKRKDETARAFHPEISECPDIIAELDLADRQYILKEVLIDFCQDSVAGCEKSESAYSGVIFIKMNEDADELCIDWVASSTRLHDGLLHFYSVRDSLKIGVVYSIVFTDARCVSLQEELEDETSHCMKLCISPRSILIGDEQWMNKWK